MKLLLLLLFKSCVLLQAARGTLLYGGPDLSLNLKFDFDPLFIIEFPSPLWNFWQLIASD